MNAHRVHVFDRADDDGIIGGVTHHLHLVFLPAQQRLVDQDLVHGRGIKARPAVVFIIVAVIGHTTARAAQCEGGADNGWQADLFQGAHAFFHGGRNGGAGILETQPIHGFAEQGPVLSHLNGIPLGPDHLNAELVQNAQFLNRKRRVQAGLATHCGQQCVGALDLDDAGDGLGRNRFDIGGVGQPGIGHDRCRVRVHQDHPVALFAQRLAGLCARVVELAGLPDHDGPRANDHDGLDIGTLGHGRLRWAAGKLSAL